MIYFTSDLHLCHDKEFIYKQRGFSNIKEMNQTIIENWNNIVKPQDEVYILGDLMLYDDVEGMRLIQKLNGKLHIILGNHDNTNRIKLFQKLPQKIVEIVYATTFKYDGYHFFLSHYPTITTNFNDSHKSLENIIISLYGHTHQKDNFYNNVPYIYHVGIDSHNLTPISIEQIIEDIKNKFYKDKK